MPAGAAGIPFREPWGVDTAQPVFMHVHDYSQGSIYAYVTDPQSPDYGKPLVPSEPGGIGSFDTWYTPDKLVVVSGNALNDGESGWSVFMVDQVYKGQWIGQNTINPIDTANPLFATGDMGSNGKKLELVGTVFGREDLRAKFSASDIPGGPPKMDFEIRGDRITLFTQPVGTFDEGAAGSSGRLPSGGPAPYEDKYVSVGYKADGTLIDGAELVLTGCGEVGYYGAPDTCAGRATFTPTPTGSGSGDTDEFLRFDGGTQLASFDNDGFIPNKVLGGPWPSADLRVHTTNSPADRDGTFDWLVSSSDPVTTYYRYIPEPLTMLAVFSGVVGLGGYIRKRRIG